MTMRYAALSTGTLNADTLVAGSTLAGASVRIADNSRQKVRGLSALAVVDVETTSLTLTAVWQVSNDASTWVNVANGTQNAAGVVIATGTAGADASVTKCYDAPQAVYGWRYARFTFLTAGATGAAVDTYNISYCFRVAKDA
jgi:hypothetical protein